MNVENGLDYDIYDNLEWGYCPTCESIVYREEGRQYWKHKGHINACYEILPEGLNVDDIPNVTCNICREY